MHHHGRWIRIAALVTIAAALSSPAAAQDARLEELERKLDELVRQAESLRQEIDQLKGAPAREDLTTIELAPEPAPPQATAAPTPSVSRALNPDIAVVGTMVGHAGDRNELEFAAPSPAPLEPGDVRDPFDFQEAEVSFTAFVDPYARGSFYFAIGPEGIDLEEGFAQFVALPHGFTAKAGKVKAAFGKANTFHTHQRPWVDQPLMIQRFFGEEGLADAGVSVSRTFDNPWGLFVEATGEVTSGDVDGVFDRQHRNDLLYNTHLKVFRDLSENSNVELGTSWARGTASGGASSFGGVDATFRWKPLSRSIYRSFRARAEALANRRDDVDGTLYGYYAAADYQFARRWIAGVRFDAADRAAGLTDRGVSAILTFWPSEFSQLRGQLRRTSYDGFRAVNEFLLQLQFSIGAHGAHAF